MLDLQKKRVRLVVLFAGLIVLSIAAEKCRELVGEEAASKSGQFALLNCLDMGSGSLACGVREGVKLYVYSLRNKHVKAIRQQATEQAITEALTGGMTATAAAKYALRAGTKAAKLASREAKRVVGPIISSGWDFFEAVYYQGTVAEGLLRGAGTLFGTYMGGFHGEERLGRIGYFAGSHLGSWVGGRIGLMVYDVISGVNYLANFVQAEEESKELGFEDADAYIKNEEAIVYEDSSELGFEDADVYIENEEAIVFKDSSEHREYYEASPEDSSERNEYYEASPEDSSEHGEYYETSPESGEVSESWGLF